MSRLDSQPLKHWQTKTQSPRCVESRHVKYQSRLNQTNDGSIFKKIFENEYIYSILIVWEFLRSWTMIYVCEGGGAVPLEATWRKRAFPMVHLSYKARLPSHLLVRCWFVQQKYWTSKNVTAKMFKIYPQCLMPQPGIPHVWQKY